jgi:hypothetical protein
VFAAIDAMNAVKPGIGDKAEESVAAQAVRWVSEN